MNYSFVNELRTSIHFNRVYRLCRCARIPTKSIFNARLGINTDQRGLRPENREIFRQPPNPSPPRAKSSDFDRKAARRPWATVARDTRRYSVTGSMDSRTQGRPFPSEEGRK